MPQNRSTGGLIEFRDYCFGHNMVLGARIKVAFANDIAQK